VLHGVRDERRESERSLQSFIEWEDVVAVSTSYKLLICINTSVFLARFSISRFEKFFIDSFHGFGC
jgi:hypothetical protein